MAADDLKEAPMPKPTAALALSRLARACHLVDTLALQPGADLAPLVELALLLRNVEAWVATALTPEAYRQHVAQATAARDTLLFGVAPDPAP